MLVRFDANTIDIFDDFCMLTVLAEVVSARLARISLAAYSKGLYGNWTDDFQLGGRY